MKKIILASGSPRRRELLAQIGYTFEVVTSEKRRGISKHGTAGNRKGTGAFKSKGRGGEDCIG